MPQDFHDPLQVFDYVHDRLENNKASLGIKYVAQLDENLLPEYPAILVTMGRQVDRTLHATRQFEVTFNLDIWIFHALLTVSKATRSREDMQLATDIRKFLHSDMTLGGHIIFGFVDGEYPGEVARVTGQKVNTIVTTRLTWTGQNRVRYEDS